MQFKNPANGHIESVSCPWLWSLLFGAFYFLVSGAWIHLTVWVLLSALFWGSMGAPGTVLVLIMQVIYAFMAGDIVRSTYLRKGWIEVGALENAEIARQAESLSEPSYWDQQTNNANWDQQTNNAKRFEPAEKLTKPAATHRNCPFCAEEIKVEAIKCKHCQSDLTATPA